MSIYFAYALKSVSRNYIYVGISNNVYRRLQEHNSGKNKTTKPYKPFKIVHIEKVGTRPQARKREKYLKSGAGKEFLKQLV